MSEWGPIRCANVYVPRPGDIVVTLGALVGAALLGSCTGGAEACGDCRAPLLVGIASHGSGGAAAGGLGGGAGSAVAEDHDGGAVATGQDGPPTAAGTTGGNGRGSGSAGALAGTAGQPAADQGASGSAGMGGADDGGAGGDAGAVAGAGSGGASSTGVTCNDGPLTCATSNYEIGGAVSGLTGAGLVLQNNGLDDLAVSTEGPFTFAAKLSSGAAYAVTVKTQPAGESCAVTSGNGTVTNRNVTDVAVTCSPASVQLLTDCSSGSAVLDTLSGPGCHGSVAAGGASYILMNGTARATLWSGPNCTGCSYVVRSDLNFCTAGYYSQSCGGLNDNVRSVSIP